MADPRFFKKERSFTVEQLVQELDYSLSSDLSVDTIIHDVKSLQDATASDISFLDNIKYKEDFLATKAGACFVSPQIAKIAPETIPCIITETPYKAYALAAQKFYPVKRPEQYLAKTAVIDKSATIGSGAHISDYVHISQNVEIGKNVWIEPGVVIGEGVKIGDRCRIGSHATLSHTYIGDDVRLYPGVRVGQDGFGFAIDIKGHVKVPQLGRVIIEDHVEIGSNTTIDRGAGPDTVIGQGTWIDNLVQIGHNVKIGRGCVIVSQVGISGSTVLEDYVAIGGQGGIAGHLRIGQGARIAAQSGVMNDLKGGQDYMGSPAFPKTQYFRQIAALNRLIKKKKND